MRRATERRCSIELKKDGGDVKCPDKIVFNIPEHGSLYYLSSVTTSKIATHFVRRWHEILGHCNVKDVLKSEIVLNIS